MNTRRNALGVALFLAITVLAPSSLVAQPTDATLKAVPNLRPELQPFASLLGNWKGEGSATVPNVGEMAWTSHSTVKPVLDGKFIQAEMVIQFDLGTLLYRSYYAWDASQEKIVTYSIGNTGEFEVSDHVRWAPDGKLLIYTTKIEEGVPMVTRNVTTINENEQSFLWQVASGAGDFETTVSGSSKKVAEEFKITESQWSAPFMPGMPMAPEMEKLSGMIGDYKVRGKVSMNPAMPPMEVTADETVRSIFGGAAIMIHVKGDPTPAAGNFRHEAIAIMTWDPARKCFKEFWISNGGDTAVQELRFVDERKLVTVHASMQMGTPQAVRGVIHLDESGGLKRSVMNRLYGAQASDTYFEGTYEKMPQ